MNRDKNMTENRRILLVEDDPSLGYLLSEYLGMKSFDVLWVKNGFEALKQIESGIFDLAVLDVMMPDMDGFTLAKKMQEQHSDIPFLFLTSRSMKIDVLKGFSLGAVDYLKKPIDEEELVVRLNSLLSRLSPVAHQAEKSSQLDRRLGDYLFDPDLDELRYNDGSVQKLTRREAGVLDLLLRHKNELCTHKEILNTLWGKNDFFTKKSLNVFVSHLRKHLSKDASIRIENVHNQGFILRTD
jgi:DNA-binding response OmpR family regulator